MHYIHNTSSTVCVIIFVGRLSLKPSLHISCLSSLNLLLNPFHLPLSQHSIQDEYIFMFFISLVYV